MALVSIVTPVYNGEAFLAECIGSVLAQTCTDWEFIVVDNCSSDGSRAIAQGFAARDQRIRVYHNDTVLPVIASFNRAASFVSPDSRYVKFLCADDVLFPDCVQRMVDVGEAHPDVQMVAAYKIHGRHPVCEGPAYPEQTLEGREVCRRFFEGTLGYLGSPTDHLLRWPIAMTDGRLFDEAFLHADIELWVRLLKTGATYGFVHQVLTFTRVHEGAVSGFAHVMGTGGLEFLAMLLRHGRSFLTPDDHARLVRLYRRRYSRFLFRVLLKVWDRRIWRFQTESWRKFDVDVTLFEVLMAGISESTASAVSPVTTMLRLKRERARTASRQ
jgi:glycosyltransferase involved in cell wall biosynthesis